MSTNLRVHLSVHLQGILLSAATDYKIFEFNKRFLRERGMASDPKMESLVFLSLFQTNSAMATLGLKEMGKILWEGKEKGLPCWLPQFFETKLRQPTGQTFFLSFPKELSHFLQT